MPLEEEEDDDDCDASLFSTAMLKEYCSVGPVDAETDVSWITITDHRPRSSASSTSSEVAATDLDLLSIHSPKRPKLTSDYVKWNFDRLPALSDIIGAKACVEMLNTVIAKPLKAPELFGTDGFMRRDKLLCILGPPGSGKHTVVSSFCSEHQIRVYHVDARMAPPNMMMALLQNAMADPPVVIVFHDCDHLFPSGTQSGLLNYAFSETLDRMPDINVWVVICCSINISEINPLLVHRMIGSVVVLQPLDEQESTEMLLRVLKNKYADYGAEFDELDRHKEIFDLVKKAMAYCGPGDIVEYCRNVFACRLKKLTDSETKEARADPRIRLPLYKQFSQCMHEYTIPAAIANPQGQLKASIYEEKTNQRTFNTIIPNLGARLDAITRCKCQDPTMLFETDDALEAKSDRVEERSKNGTDVAARRNLAASMDSVLAPASAVRGRGVSAMKRARDMTRSVSNDENS